MGQSLGNESLEENLCILGVPQIQTRAKPGYNLSYSISFKVFLFQDMLKNVVVKLHVSRLGLH